MHHPLAHTPVQLTAPSLSVPTSSSACRAASSSSMLSLPPLVSRSLPAFWADSLCRRSLASATARCRPRRSRHTCGMEQGVHGGGKLRGKARQGRVVACKACLHDHMTTPKLGVRCC